MLTKIQKRQAAQDNLLHYARSAFYANADDNGLTANEKAEMEIILQQQFERIEKLFGFEKGSFKS